MRPQCVLLHRELVLTRLNELVGRCVAPPDVVQAILAQWLLRCYELHVLTRSRVRAENVAPACDGESFSTCNTTVARGSVSIRRMDASSHLGGATGIGGDHLLIVVIYNAIGYYAIRALLVHFHDFFFQIRIEWGLAYSSHYFFLTRK